MKIVVIGASGTVGRAVAEELSRQHQVIRVGRTQGDLQVDITSQPSVEALFETVGRVDAIVSATGNLFFGPLASMTDRDFNQGLQGQLLGQIRLALTGQHYLNEAVRLRLSAALWPMNRLPRRQRHNGECRAGGFVRAAACELPRGIVST